MCGIAGCFGDYPAAVVRGMTNRLAHRGPDGSGCWFDEEAGIGLGHRRLSIIDLSDAAAQPMMGVGGRYQVVFNGEIYNFRDQAAHLERNGYRLNVKSDTGVLAPLYDQMGAGMLDCLSGMFAFAIWDAHDRRLFLGRDHYGIKPLYYAETPRGFVFASEIKALLEVPDLDRALDLEAIPQFLAYQYCPGPATPFRGVRKLPPGHYLQVDKTGIRLTRWHTPPLARAESYDERPASLLRDELRALLDTVIEEQSVSDVDLGVFLSGGVDSSAVAATMRRRGIPIARSFCISFAGASMTSEGFGDDAPFARDLAKAWGLPFTAIAAKEPDMSEIEAMIYQLDEPLGDLAPLLVRQISQAARADGIKVLMSGAGGDDVFSGYRRHQVAWLLERAPTLSRLTGIGAGALSPLLAGTLGNRLARFADMTSSSSKEHNLRRLFAFNAPVDVQAILGPAFNGSLAPMVSEWMDSGLAATVGAPIIDRTLAAEFLGFLPDHNLAYTDKASMAEGIEVRVPLIDPRLVTFASRLPTRLKMPFGEPKGFFKKAMDDRLPQSILRRKKTGFGVPMRAWLTGGLRSPFLDIIRSQRFRQRGLFDAPAVEALFSRVVERKTSGAYLLLAVVAIELWCRHFADGARSDGHNKSALAPSLE